MARLQLWQAPPSNPFTLAKNPLRSISSEPHFGQRVFS
jgi:hypothetical protein